MRVAVLLWQGPIAPLDLRQRSLLLPAIRLAWWAPAPLLPLMIVMAIRVLLCLGRIGPVIATTPKRLLLAVAVSKLLVGSAVRVLMCRRSCSHITRRLASPTTLWRLQ